MYDVIGKVIACQLLPCYTLGGTIVLQGGRPLFLHRMGVVLMNNNHFDFKDFMAFGMFILALLTFIFMFSK